MKPIVLIPLLGFLLLALVLGIGLTIDPSKVDSPLIGKPVPAFSLPSLQHPEQTLSSDIFLGQVSLLNVWASWCPACRDEHQMLLHIQRQNILPIYGFNYKDSRDKGLQWLRQLGDPYREVFFDASGRSGIELGVYGAPETFIIDQHGVIAAKHIGPITPRDWQGSLLPIINKLKGKSQ